MANRGPSLANKSILAKIDRLRELNVGAIVPLPQLVVVGDQSSGKSSVLESITGFSFPRAAGLCTRYATQITCSREYERSVAVSIIPRPDADDDLKDRLLRFNKRIPCLDNDTLAKIFYDANVTMGIRMENESFNASTQAFSQDILKIEISGPEENHLTVIDVPGIFRVATPDLTTENDIIMVENMVKSYMADSRTIILAVMPCNVDIATQEILKLAEAADPDGNRTMGVLTKPDLATEHATQRAVMDLLERRRNVLRLGYYVVKNRSADDETSTLADRFAAEKAFFAAPPWTAVPDRCGIPALKTCLSGLLVQISRMALPILKLEFEQKLALCKSKLNAMGPSRADQNAQRQFLGKIASRFQAVTHSALHAHYTGESAFLKDAKLKLITRVIELNIDFASLFATNGHVYSFTLEHQSLPSHQKQDAVLKDADESSRSLSPTQNAVADNELEDIIDTDALNAEISSPSDKSILLTIQNIFKASRGPELGTFNGTVLAAAFREQSDKWDKLVLAHTSRAIVIVHDYITRLLKLYCPELAVRELLWSSVLRDRLRPAYCRAMEHARFLISIERESPPSTYNHYFNDTLQNARAEKLRRNLKSMGASTSSDQEVTINLERLAKPSNDKSNDDQVCEDILDTLFSYYKVARKRFVDNVCQQVVSYFLLSGPDSPLSIFTPDLVMSLDDAVLEEIAGEDDGTKMQRRDLVRSIERLTAAAAVLRS